MCGEFKKNMLSHNLLCVQHDDELFNLERHIFLLLQRKERELKNGYFIHIFCSYFYSPMWRIHVTWTENQ